MHASSGPHLSCLPSPAAQSRTPPSTTPHPTCCTMERASAMRPVPSSPMCLVILKMRVMLLGSRSLSWWGGGGRGGGLSDAAGVQELILVGDVGKGYS